MSARELPPLPLQTAADAALERVIKAITDAIVVTGDRRLVDMQRSAVGMRSAGQVMRMERERKIA